MTCGDFGGLTVKSEPCRRVAGWGVSGDDSGRCKQHIDQVPEAETYTAPLGYTYVVTADGSFTAATAVTLTPQKAEVPEPTPGPEPEEPEPEPEEPPIVVEPPDEEEPPIIVDPPDYEPSERYPNEPAGYVPWFEHDWQSWPNEVNGRLRASVAGVIKASHSESDAATAFVLVDDPTAPHGKGKSLRHRQRKGQRNGTTSGIFNLFHPKPGMPLGSESHSDQVTIRSVYRSHWVYFEPDPVTGDWQFGNAHMRTFWANRNYGTSRQAVSLRCPDNPLARRLPHYAGSNVWHSAPTTVYKSPRLNLSIGVWRQHEYLWEILQGQPGDSNPVTARIRAWIDGSVVIDRTIQHLVDRAMGNEHFAMVWLGGSEGVRTQDDFIRFGDIYISGEPS